MKPLRINDYAEIKAGTCAGISEVVVALDWLLYQVTLRTSDGTQIIVNWENVEQEEQRSEDIE